MNLLLFFLVSCLVMGLRAERRDELPRTRSVLILVAVVSTGYLSRRFI